MKSSYLLSVLVVFSCVSCVSVKRHNAIIGKLHSPEELKEDVDFTYGKFKRLHPNLYQYVAKQTLDAKFDSLKSAIRSPLSSKQFYKLLAPVISEIRQGHIAGKIPHERFTKKERKSKKKLKFDFYELDFEFLDDALFITRTGPKDSTLLYHKVLAINGQEIPKILWEYQKTFSSDGFNKTFKNRYLGLRFAGFYVQHHGYLDSVSLKLKAPGSVYTKWFKRYDKTAKDSAKIRQDTLDKRSKPRLETAAKSKAKQQLKAIKKEKRHRGYRTSRKHYTRNFSFLDSSRTIGYFKIRSWGNGPYKKFYKESFAKLDAANAAHLVLDLRDNTGGRLAEIANFYKYLAQDDFIMVDKARVTTRLPHLKNLYRANQGLFGQLMATLAVPFLVTHDLLRTRKENGDWYYKFSESKSKKPANKAFNGEVYVLINGNSFSASSLISTNLKATKRAIFIGEETGGAYNGTVAGQYKTVILPNSKLGFRFGLMQVETPFKQQPDGFGVRPDVEIKPTISDRVLGKDPELEWVLEDIKAKQKHPK